MRIKQLRLLTLSDTPAHFAENEFRLAETHSKLNDACKIHELLVASLEEQRLYDAFAGTWSRLEQVDTEMRHLIKAGQQPAALALMAGLDVVHLYVEARSDLSCDVSLNEQGARRDADAAMAESDAATLAAYIAVALYLAAAAAATSFGLLRVSLPIQAMTGAMSVLAGSDAAAEVPYRQRQDEIGAMAMAVQVAATPNAT